MPQRTCVLLVVALNRRLLAHAPNLARVAREGRAWTVRPPLPAVTCTVQASMLTGLSPNGHGVVANGWYNREQAEVQFWKQSNALMHGEKVWETARRRDPSVTCAKLFWWFNMYSSADVSITPRPIYKADGRKLPDIYTHPPGLRERLQGELGRFPLFQFWGPGAGIASSAWIAESYLAVEREFAPTLALVYLPHLDYDLQRFGPDDARIPAAVGEIDAVCGRLLDHNRERGIRTLVVSEYGIEAVSQPIAINRVLREAGWLAVREEDGGELLDPGASAAFGVADHQVAHVYVRDPARVDDVARLCAQVPGVERVLGRAERAALGLDHARAGELLLVARPGAWFSYQYWLDARRAPDFARTVDIHRKPGYDPLELHLDPRLWWPKAQIAWRLARKALGLRTLMDVIPLDNTLVRGSHGRVDIAPELRPVLLADAETAKTIEQDGSAGASRSRADGDEIAAEGVRDAILAAIFGTA